MRSSIALLLAAACGGSQSSSPSPATPAAGSLAAAPVGSPACERAGRPPVAAGQRRLELSLDANPGATEVTVDGAPRVAAQSGKSCAYVELEPGAHDFTVRARGYQGLGTHFKLSAENPKQPWWYDVFSISCGQPTCEKEPLAAWGRQAQGDRRALTDPCSAMQVRNVKWASERAPGRDLVVGLTLTFTVFIYKDAFPNQPRDASCPEN